MTKLLVFLALALTIYAVDARHVHPRSIVTLEKDGKTSEANPEIDGTSIEVIRNMAPNRFVPINNAHFFKSMEPCEEGLDRDLLGICREVWD